MGTLWSEFRRGMRRGKPPPLPAGLTRCAECAEPRGRTRFSDKATGTAVELDIACICEGVPCAWCGQMPVRRPVSNRYDVDTAEVRHSGAWASEVPCPHCRADGAASAPRSPQVARYEIGATPFYGEAPPSADYFACRRYRTFEGGLVRFAARYGVELLNVARVQGIWQGQQEPSALISVKAPADALLALMAELARRWGQEAVIGFSSDLPGDARLHTAASQLAPEEVCELLDGSELSGLSVGAGGVVSILDLRGDQSDRVQSALSRLGVTGTQRRGHGFLHLRSGSA